MDDQWHRAGVLLLACGCGGSGSGGSGDFPAPPPTSAPDPTPPTPSTFIPNPVPECETRGEYTVCVILQDTRMGAETVGHLNERYFTVYPQLTERFNRAAPRSVDFVIGNSSFVAVADGHQVTYQLTWLLQHPQDYDVAVHELMHIVEAYNWGAVPGWLTEGIADYARYHYGVNNAAAGWQMQPLAAGQSYKDGYGVTARFLVWVEERYQFDLVEMLDTALRGGSYDQALWVSYTGKSVDALWVEYLADPFIAPLP